MRRLLMLLFLLFLLLSACSTNESGLELAKDYTAEIVPIINNAYLDITGQAYEGELSDSLTEYAEQIRSVNETYWDGHLFGEYTDEDIRKWKFTMQNSQGETWEINGEELSNALAYINFNSSMLADDIEKAIENPSEETYMALGESLDIAYQSAEQLVQIILNQ